MCDAVWASRAFGSGVTGRAALFVRGVKLRLVPHFDLLPAVKNGKATTHIAPI